MPPLVENLGTLPGATGSVAYSINDSGEVAGVSDYANNSYRAFVYTDADGDGDEEMVDIGDLGGGTAAANSINNSGTATGSSGKMFDDVVHSRAFRYTPGLSGQPGTMEDLGQLGTSLLRDSSGMDINDNGDVVGYSHSVKWKWLIVDHAFLYTDDGGTIDLGTLGGPSSRAFGINNSGEIVGVSEEESRGGPSHGFVCTNKTTDPDPDKFVMFKLERLIERVNGVPGDYHGDPISPRKINDYGQICGSADGQAVLLTPLPPLP